MTKKFYIKTKKDWGSYGWYDSKTRTANNRYGFVVTDGICNIMPGAIWFKTIEDAFKGLKLLHQANFNSTQFHSLCNHEKWS